jgi:hypothetical protein
MKEDCRVITHHLLEYVFHELDEGLRSRVGQHLSACKPCHREFLDLQKTLTLIDAVTLEPEDTLPDNFASIVVAIIQRRQAERPNPIYQYLVAACIALFFLNISFSTLQPGRNNLSLDDRQSYQQAYYQETRDPLLADLLAQHDLILKAFKQEGRIL